MIRRHSSRVAHFPGRLKHTLFSSCRAAALAATLSSCLAAALGLTALSSHAGENRKVFDQDGDYLIEIYDLADLNAIRYTKDYVGLYGQYDVCPGPCQGYELMNTLDFDTSGDGKLDAQDAYWNEGKGWLPIQIDLRTDLTFGGGFRFNGNGHTIRNLMINRPDTANVGLFGSLTKADFSNIGITGALTSITGGKKAGLFAGDLTNGHFYSTFVTGRVQGDTAGGFVGKGNGLNFNTSFSTAKITARQQAGNFVGLGVGVSVNQSYAVGQVASANYKGAFVGYGSTVQLNQSYWATDATTATTAIAETGFEQAELLESTGATLAQMQCGLNAPCTTQAPLFIDWNNPNFSLIPIWLIKGNGVLPALHIEGHFYRDNDFNSEPDAISTVDSDRDGLIDEFDDFPKNPFALYDADHDGLVDGLVGACGAECLSTSSDVWDPSPNDTDNDGLTNEYDEDLLSDNGAPVITVDDLLPLHQVSEGELTSVTLPIPTAAFKDLRDTQLSFRVINPNEPNAELEEHWQTTSEAITLKLKSTTTLLWFARDKNGNVSNPLPQKIYLHKPAGFLQTQITAAEGNTMSIHPNYETSSNEYPVLIKFAVVKNLSSADASDISPYRSVYNYTTQLDNLITLKVLKDTLKENDETLVLKMLSATVQAPTPFKLPIDKATEQLTITITERNLPPSNISFNIGNRQNLFDPSPLIINATVEDPNGNDQHTLKWVGEGFTLLNKEGTQIKVESDALYPGFYLDVVATDNGQPALSTVVHRFVIRCYGWGKSGQNDFIFANAPEGGVLREAGFFSCDPIRSSSRSSVSSVIQNSSASSISQASASSLSKSSASQASAVSSASSKGSKTAGGSGSLWLLGGLIALTLLRRKKALTHYV